MSLVAYGCSSGDDDSDSDSDCAEMTEVADPAASNVSDARSHVDDASKMGHGQEQGEGMAHNMVTLSLPPPRKQLHSMAFSQRMEHDATTMPTFSKLPTPKCGFMSGERPIQEEDDEFLHKKSMPSAASSSSKTKRTVTITVPALAHFDEMDDEDDEMAATKGKAPHAKGCGLLSLLPKAKSERDFGRGANTTPMRDTAKEAMSTVMAFIPDTVKYRRPAKNTEDVDFVKRRNVKAPPPPPPLLPSPLPPPPPAVLAAAKETRPDGSDSPTSDEDDMTPHDFFSLNAREDLPDVSGSEIDVLVAREAARAAEAKQRFLKAMDDEVRCESKETAPDSRPMVEVPKRLAASSGGNGLDDEAMQALVGGTAKRRRKQRETIEVVEIRGDEVLPNRDEWMRTALATSTTYQPTGVLVDDELTAGTRRKHQITYLAHKAKSNEAELQAMWAANRQQRRATQSKYGF